MAKPIAIVYIDQQFDSPNLRQAQDALQDRMPDYHVFVIPNPNQEKALEMQVFHEKDFTEIQYEELKSMIEKHLNELTTNK